MDSSGIFCYNDLNSRMIKNEEGNKYLIQKKHMDWLENFSVAVSMIVGMAVAVFVSL